MQRARSDLTRCRVTDALDDVHESLNDMQRTFVDEYLVDHNATKAAIRSGYSPKSARQHGSHLLSNTYIAAAIHKAQAVRSKRTGVTAERVLRELARVAFSDVTEVVESTRGELTFVDIKALPPRVTRAIESLSEKPGEHGTARTVKMHPKLGALKMLVDHLGLNADTVSKIELTGKDGGPVESRVTAAVIVLPARSAEPEDA